MRDGDPDGEQRGEYPAGGAGLVQFLADHNDVGGVTTLTAELLAEARAEQAGRGRLSAEFPGQFAGAFPFVDVPEDLPFGEGAHRLS